MLSLIACMYGPRSVDPSALVPRLRFTISGAERRAARTKARRGYAQLFARAVHRYIKGLGHPEHRLMKDFQTVSQADVVGAVGNAGTRSQILLAAFTESTELPRDDLPWTLQVGNPLAPTYCFC